MSTEMNIETERRELMKQLEQINDIKLLQALKKVLLNSLKNDKDLEDSISNAIIQSDNGEGRLHEEVIHGLRDEFKI